MKRSRNNTRSSQSHQNWRYLCIPIELALVLLIQHFSSCDYAHAFSAHDNLPAATAVNKRRAAWFSPFYQPQPKNFACFATSINSPSSSAMASHAGSSPQTFSKPKRSTERTDRNKQKNSGKKFKIKAMFQQAKGLERKGQWNLACQKLEQILEWDPHDAHSHLALARLQARREANTYLANKGGNSNTIEAPQLESTHPQSTVSACTGSTTTAAQQAFQRGTDLCPNSVHLWQAWAVYEEQNRNNIELATELYERAMQIDSHNPYVCHAYGLMLKNKCQQPAQAQVLWERALTQTSTAALVCSVGELLIAQKLYDRARDLYTTHLPKLSSPKDKTEVYLASAWLEERYCQNYGRAHQLLQMALEFCPSSSLAHVALARLEGRGATNKDSKRATVRRLASACMMDAIEATRKPNDERNQTKRRPQDGRVFNAWAHLEVQDRKYEKARKILAHGIARYPKDPMLLQAAGKVEEHVGNYTGARDLYSASLVLEPTAPTLVAYAMLELQHPTSENGKTNYTYVKRLFEEALLIDPRHGPAYNAYGKAELRHGSLDEAKKIFDRGVQANCADAASIYHGYAKMELSLGNVDRARGLLESGRHVSILQDVGMDSQHRGRALFLSHTLGMLELNSNRPSKAYEIFMDGIERYGNSSQLLLGAALCEVKLGKQDSARELFERSILIDNKHAQAWQAWGVMEMRAGNITTARKLFDCGIKSAPRHGALWQAYATMEGRLGEIQKARALFISGIKKASRHVPLYQAWASLELREDNVIAAKRLLTRALTLDKRNGSGWLIAANIEKRLGNHGLVGLILRRGIECAPTEAELYRALGEHLVAKGDIENAREIFERGIEVNPLHAPIYHSLAELEARVFNVEGLARLNRKAAEVFNSNALEPSPSSSQAWGMRIRAMRSSDVPKRVAALAQKIVEEDGAEDLSMEEDVDPFTALDSIGDVFVEDDFIGELLETNNITDT